MKKILSVLIFVFALSIFSIEHSYAECFLFDGTYIGSATLTNSNGDKANYPLFIVVANKHITGFFGPENQNHTLSGISFNLGGLTVSDVYTLSLTADDKILVKSTDGTINGKAKLGNVEGGSGSFSGYYNSNTVSDFAPGDFLNIGSDGSVILKVAISEDKVVHAFGKINASGEFVQVFPEKGNGPHVNLSISGDTADIEVTLKGNSFTTAMRKFPGASCGDNNSTSSSSGGTSSSSSNKPAFVINFLGALNSLSQLSSTSLHGAETQVLALQELIKVIKYTIIAFSTPKDCSDLLKKSFETLPEDINDIKIAACGSDLMSCTSAQAFTISFLGDAQLSLKENGSLDENNNEIFDICEQPSVFDEKDALSFIFTIFNGALRDVEIYSNKVRKGARGLVGKEVNTEKLLASISKLRKRIQTTLKLPASLCNLSIKDDGKKLTDAIDSAFTNICVVDFGSPNSAIRDVCDNTSFRAVFNKLTDASSIIEDFVTIDTNKNEIIDICE